MKPALKDMRAPLIILCVIFALFAAFVYASSDPQSEIENYGVLVDRLESEIVPIKIWGSVCLDMTVDQNDGAGTSNPTSSIFIARECDDSFENRLATFTSDGPFEQRAVAERITQVLSDNVHPVRIESSCYAMSMAANSYDNVIGSRGQLLFLLDCENEAVLDRLPQGFTSNSML